MTKKICEGINIQLALWPDSEDEVRALLQEMGVRDYISTRELIRIEGAYVGGSIFDSAGTLEDIKDAFTLYKNSNIIIYGNLYGCWIVYQTLLAQGITATALFPAKADKWSSWSKEFIRIPVVSRDELAEMCGVGDVLLQPAYRVDDLDIQVLKCSRLGVKKAIVREKLLCLDLDSILQYSETSEELETAINFTFDQNRRYSYDAMVEKGVGAPPYDLMRFIANPPKTGNHTLTATLECVGAKYYSLEHKPSGFATLKRLIPADTTIKLVTAIRDPIAQEIIYLLSSRGGAGAGTPAETEAPRRNVVVTADNVEEVLEEVVENREFVPPGYYTVTMNPTWHFAKGDAASYDAVVENVEENTNDVYFDIVLAENESIVLYQSPVIPRGATLKDIALDLPLEKGEHNGVVIYHLIDEDQNTLSTLRVTLKLIVES